MHTQSVSIHKTLQAMTYHNFYSIIQLFQTRPRHPLIYRENTIAETLQTIRPP